MKTKVLFISTSDPDYSRVKLIREALREHFAVDIIESTASSYAVRFASVVIQMFLNKIAGTGVEIIYVGFMAQPIFPIVKLLWPKKKIAVDFFFSLYDTLCLDKKLAKPNSIQGKLTYFLDLLSVKYADLLVTDTDTHAEYYREEFGKNLTLNHQTVFIGADEKVFKPTSMPSVKTRLKIEFHGYFIPLQGVETIVEAAKLLQDKNAPVKITIIGDGQTFKKNVSLAEKHGLENLQFMGKKSLKEVAQTLQESHVGMGIFGNSNKAKRVIPNKAYEILASKRLLITEDSKAAKEILSHKRDALLVPPGDAKALSDMIMFVAKNPLVVEKLAEAGYHTFKKKADKRQQSIQVKKSVEKIL